MQIIYFALLGVLFALICAIAWKLMAQWSAAPLRRRLDSLAPRGDSARADGQRLLKRVLLYLARSSADKDSHSIQARLVYAGWRAPAALPLFYGAKTGLLLLCPLLLLPLVWLQRYGANQHSLLWLLLAASTGFYLPNLILQRAMKQRQRAIANSIPNTIELVTLSAEAGLGLDAALMRVASCMGGQDHALKQEFDLMLLELNAGIARASALRNLVQRTGVEELQTLSSLLIQADRFGISVGESLRAYTTLLHVRRQQRAEEEAAKVGVKLLFPLVLCIFPVLIMVLIGPAGIQIYRMLSPSLSGQS